MPCSSGRSRELAVDIRLITFDLDDTLWHTAPVIARAEQALQQWLAQRSPQLGLMSLSRLQQLKTQVLAKMPQIAHSVSAVRFEVLRQAYLEAGETAGQAGLLAEEAFQFFLGERQRVTVSPQVRPMLKALRQRGYLLGALSNGNADIRRVGLGEYFDFALSADALGVGKPHAAAFGAALGRAGVAPQQALHLGDNPQDDVAGALAAGMHAVWFNAAGLDWPGGTPPTAQICCLSELPGLLAGKTGAPQAGERQ